MVQRAQALDDTFAALSDGTRRAILERLARGTATLSELAVDSGMTLTGVRKHVRLLESTGLVSTQKLGRVRSCSLGPRLLEAEAAWIQQFQHAGMLASMHQGFAELVQGPKA